MQARGDQLTAGAARPPGRRHFGDLVGEASALALPKIYCWKQKEAAVTPGTPKWPARPRGVLLSCVHGVQLSWRLHIVRLRSCKRLCLHLDQGAPVTGVVDAWW